MGSTTYSYVEAGRLRARDSLIVNGSVVINSSLQAGFNSVASNAYSAGGASGMDAAQNVVVAVVPSMTTITYATPGGGSASTAVVTGVSVTTVARTFTKGLLTG
jgi:ABC-type amino acid transport system permease subunit